MNSTKWQRLFNSARNDKPPTPSSALEARVLRAIRNELQSTPSDLFQQLTDLFPRLASASALMIVLCLATDVWISGFNQSKLAADIEQLSDQWLFTTKGF